jgi:hypothetical protein
VEEMELSALKYPSMRDELIDYVTALSDITYQQRYWIGGETSDEVKHDELDYAIHFLYDDTCLSRNPLEAIGLFLKNDDEAALVGDLIGALEKVFDIYGTKLGDNEYIKTSEWKDVISRAGKLKAALS